MEQEQSKATKHDGRSKLPEYSVWKGIRTTTRFVTIGKETKSIKQWSDVYGISDNTVRDRVYRGWDVIKAIITPARKGNYHGPVS